MTFVVGIHYNRIVKSLIQIINYFVRLYFGGSYIC